MSSCQDNLIVTEAEAAHMLRISPRTLQRMRALGGGPPIVRLSERRIGYSVAALNAWMADRTEQPGPGPAAAGV